MGAEADLTEHYGRGGGIAGAILSALESAGRPTAGPVPREALAGADEFHLGGAAATAAVLDALSLLPTDRVLDIGCGVGGPARAIAAAADCAVTGIDLTPEFVDAAQELSAVSGFDHRTTFRVADATAVDDDDGSYTAATMFHVGMNLPDKTAVFAEVRRLLQPEGRFVIYDLMRTAPGELTFPLPWSAVPETSHVATPDEYVEALTAAGFSPSAPVDHRGLVAEVLRRAAADPPAVNLTHLMGPGFPEMIGNLIGSFRAGVVSPIQLVATA